MRTCFKPRQQARVLALAPIQVPHPWTPVCLPPTPTHTAASGLFMVGLWATKAQPVPRVDRGFLLALLPVALFHTIGHVSACLSFSQMAVSFAHIVKSSEPVRCRPPLLAARSSHAQHACQARCCSRRVLHQTAACGCREHCPLLPALLLAW